MRDGKRDSVTNSRSCVRNPKSWVPRPEFIGDKVDDKVWAWGGGVWLGVFYP